MKKSLIFTFILFSVHLSLIAQETKPPKPVPPTIAQPPVGISTNIEFEKSTIDFGEIVTGDKVEHVFKFTNTGDNPLVISNAKGSCGCTVPQWPKEPIGIGEKAEILVVFNSKGKSGKQSKTVTITANTNPPQTIIKLEGNVLKEDQKETGN